MLQMVIVVSMAWGFGLGIWLGITVGKRQMLKQLRKDMVKR